MACSHCSLPVPAGLVRPDDEHQFCCRGCAAAYEIIHAHGLEGFYVMAEGIGQAATGDRTLRYAELDRPAFIERTTTLHPGGERSVTLGLDGIHCAACIWLLERLPRVVPGVVDARVDFRRSTIAVRWRDDAVTLSAIAEGIASLGYRPHPLRTDIREAGRRVEDRRRMIAMGVAFAAAGNNMLIAGSLYLGLFSYMDAGVEQLLRWASCAVGLVSLAWPGRTFFRGAWSAIRPRTPHMDLPVALGLSVGGLAGLINTIRGAGELYFDTLSVLVFLLLVGRFIQVRQQRHAAAALEVLFRVTPRTAEQAGRGRLCRGSGGRPAAGRRGRGGCRGLPARGRDGGHRAIVGGRADPDWRVDPDPRGAGQHGRRGQRQRRGLGFRSASTRSARTPGWARCSRWSSSKSGRGSSSSRIGSADGSWSRCCRCRPSPSRRG